MIPRPAADVTWLLAGLVRRADTSLVHGAARNAADDLAARRANRLDTLRTLRDLRALRTRATAPTDLRPTRTRRTTRG